LIDYFDFNPFTSHLQLKIFKKWPDLPAKFGELEGKQETKK